MPSVDRADSLLESYKPPAGNLNTVLFDPLLQDELSRIYAVHSHKSLSVKS